jgi:hypothetical protein
MGKVDSLQELHDEPRMKLQQMRRSRPKGD